MQSNYIELHCKSFYSFGLGASHLHEFISQAKQYGYTSLALTDTNMCGSLEFAKLATNMGVHPITGGELILRDGTRLVLLVKNRLGYSNLCKLFTFANEVNRRNPKLSTSYLKEHLSGLVILIGGRNSQISKFVSTGRLTDAKNLVHTYLESCDPNSLYVELQQNFIHGDTERNRTLSNFAKGMHLPVVASNDVHYHDAKRYKLQTAIVAIKHNITINEALPHIHANHHLYLKSPHQMNQIFKKYPDAITNTMLIKDACEFNLSSELGYTLPEPEVPRGYTSDSYLRQLCHEGAIRRYGGIPPKVEARLEEELKLFKKLKLSGFLLIYRQIGLIAQSIMQNRGLLAPESHLEEQSPIRSRGSSVCLLSGYLIGISHIDPLKWGLTLERFISEETELLPDIDLDFPRGLRSELIKEVHRYYGTEYAVLTGAITSYRLKGVIKDLGKALGLPKDECKILSQQITSNNPNLLKEEMSKSADFCHKTNTTGWKDLIELAPQLTKAPKLLGQHIGGMILSSSAIPEMVPIRPSAMENRFIMDWDKDSIVDARFAKIDLLSLPVLDQIHEALSLIESRVGYRPDLSQINPNDSNVYDMINAGDSKGVFMLQSPAQLKMGQRLRSRNLLDLAYQLALIRPGVGINTNSVSQFIERYKNGEKWTYDHPLEERALRRGFGIIIWQEQVVQLIMDISGLSAAESDELRRAFSKTNNTYLMDIWWNKFREGALRKGVSNDIAKKIFAKINGHYMFPESHSHAFAVTAYQASWIKYYYPVEFFCALVNNQPMGFYPLETLKQDARKFGVTFINPDINESQTQSISKDESVLLGLKFIKHIGTKVADSIIGERKRQGPYISTIDFVRRTGLSSKSVTSLIYAGAFDSINSNRRMTFWESGIYNSPQNTQQFSLPLNFDDSMPQLDDFSEYEKMLGEYEAISMYPRGHIMEFIRPYVNNATSTAAEIYSINEGVTVTVAGWPVARQHPKGQNKTVFVTLEDESGDIQIVIWPNIFNHSQKILNNHLISVTGTVSRWDGTPTVIASKLKPIDMGINMPKSHDWH